MGLVLGGLVFLRFLQTAAFIALYLFSLIKFKKPKAKRITITIALYLMITVTYFGFLFQYGQEMAERLILPIEIGLCLILILICSADKWTVSLFILFTQFNLHMGICYLAYVCTTEASGLIHQIQYLIFRTIFFGALLFFNFKYLRPRFRRLVNMLKVEWYLITLASFFFCVLELAILYIPRIYWYEADRRWYLVATSYLVFLGVYWLIYQSISAIVKKYESQDREHILSIQNKMWEEQIDAQKHAIHAARRDRHDLRHHYDTLLSMLESGKEKDAIAYLNAQTQRTENDVLAGICEHSAANAILSRWEARAKEHDIKIEMDANIPANLPMDDISLVCILANSFENAVEGCLKCPSDREKFITIKIAYTVYNGAGKLHIVVENSCSDSIHFENGFPKSEKTGGGTGTQSIFFAAEKYNGMADFAAQDGIFRTRVLLHLVHHA